MTLVQWYKKIQHITDFVKLDSHSSRANMAMNFLDTPLQLGIYTMVIDGSTTARDFQKDVIKLNMLCKWGAMVVKTMSRHILDLKKKWDAVSGWREVEILFAHHQPEKPGVYCYVHTPSLSSEIQWDDVWNYFVTREKVQQWLDDDEGTNFLTAENIAMPVDIDTDDEDSNILCVYSAAQKNRLIECALIEERDALEFQSKELAASLELEDHVFYVVIHSLLSYVEGNDFVM